MPLKTVIKLDCSEDTMKARLLERGKTSGRSDDNMESIKKRLKVYRKQTQKIMDKIERDEDNLVIKVSADQSADKVFE